MLVPSRSFYFIRHGETDWNQRHIYMGSQDIPLNQIGLSQAESVSSLLKGEPIQHIVSSPLSRALKTAEIIQRKIQKPITVIDELKEADWGNAEGKPYVSTLFQEWHSGATHEGAESFYKFKKRVIFGFEKALNLKEPVLIVSHGGVYFVINKLLRLPFSPLLNCVPYYHRPPDKETHTWFSYPLLCGSN